MLTLSIIFDLKGSQLWKIFKLNYLGLKLKNPLIAGSCGLTNSVSNIKELASKGVGAVVIKSLFEEQINIETENVIRTEEGTAQNIYTGS